MGLTLIAEMWLVMGTTDFCSLFYFFTVLDLTFEVLKVDKNDSVSR